MSNSRSRSMKDIAKKQNEYVENERQMMKMNANNAQKDNRRMKKLLTLVPSSWYQAENLTFREHQEKIV